MGDPRLKKGYIHARDLFRQGNTTSAQLANLLRIPYECFILVHFIRGSRYQLRIEGDKT